MSDDVDNTQFRDIWRDALVQYTERSGASLPSPDEFARNPDEALTMVIHRMETFKEFRSRKESVLKVVKPFFDVVKIFADKAGDAASLAPAPYDSATKLLFAAVSMLLQAAKEVSKSYDLIIELLHTLNATLERLKVHLGHSITAPLRRILVDALVQLLLILGMARKIIAEGRFGRYLKSLIGQNIDVANAVKELDRILAREQSMVAATVLDHTTQLVEHMRLQTPVPSPSSNLHPEPKQCPPPTALFTGRVDALAQMRKFFFGTVSKRHTFVLHGLGGAGKTQIACQFVDDALEDPTNNFSEVFFIDASSIDTLSADLSLIAKAKGRGTDAQSALRWLAAERTRWLMIFDNADDPALNLHDYFPPRAHGNILITTRNYDMIRHATPGHESCFRVSDMQPEDSVELLLKAANVPLPDLDSKAHATQLAQELGYFALALIQAGAYIATMQLTVLDYMRLFRESRSQVLERYRDIAQRTDTYSATVYTTWRISYDRLSELSRNLLHICSFMHHEDIVLVYFELAAKRSQEYEPEAPFTEIESAAFALAQTFLSHFRNEDHSWNETKFRETAHELILYSLVHFDINNKAYSIHPLVQEWCRVIVHTPITRVSVQALLAMLISYNNSVEVLSFKRKLLPHVSDVLSMEDSELTSVPNIADRLESVYSVAGSWIMAEKLQKITLEYFMKAKGKEDSATLTNMNNLASTYWNQGQLNEAEKLEKEVLEIRKRVLGPEHPDTLSSISNLASTYWNQGQLNEAEKLEKEVLEIRKRVLGPEHPDTLSIISNLASTYWNQGQLNEAEKLQKEVLEIRKRVLGPEHPDTLSSMNNLATVYMAQGQLNEAEKLEKEVLEIRKRVLGPEHPDTLASMNNLASTYWKQGQLNEAEKLHKEVLEITKRVLGPEHPGTLTSINNLASTYRDQGQLNEAEKLLKEVLETMSQVLGPEHPTTLSTMNNLAYTYSQQKRWAEAVELMTRTVEGMKQVLGNEHPNTIGSVEALEDFQLALHKQTQQANDI